MTQPNPSRYRRLRDSVVYGQANDWYLDTTTGKPVLFIADAVFVPSGSFLVGDGTDLVAVAPSGDVTMSAAGVMAVGTAVLDGTELAKPRIRCIREQVTAAGLTDGGAAIGTKTLAATVPAGAVVLRSTLDTIVGFTGDTSAVVTLGDGTDVDRYNTGTPSVFTTAAAGVDMGAPSGTAWHTEAKALVATVTSAADITPVLASGGSFYATIWFLEPI